MLQSAGLLFFAFAGYARIATMGEGVRDPRRTIPRAIPIALTITGLVYVVVAVAALLALGPENLATAGASLVAAVQAVGANALAPVVRVGATLAALGVLPALIAGIGRTTLAMARNRDLPTWLAAVHPRFRVPHHAELTLAVIVSGLVLATDLRGVIGFSSFGVLIYYAIANAAGFHPTGRATPMAPGPADHRNLRQHRSCRDPAVGIHRRRGDHVPDWPHRPLGGSQTPRSRLRALTFELPDGPTGGVG